MGREGLRQRSVLIAIASMLVLVGCGGSIEPKVTTIQHRPGLEVVTYPQGIRAAYLTHSRTVSGGATTDRTRVCAEPAQDIAIERALKIAGEASVNVKKVDTNASGTVELAEEVVALAGRTQLVLLARELLYRLCESADDLGEATPKGNRLAMMYTQTLDAIKALATAEQLKAQAKIHVSDAAAAAAFAPPAETCESTRDACVKAAGEDEAKKAKCPTCPKPERPAASKPSPDAEEGKK